MLCWVSSDVDVFHFSLPVAVSVHFPFSAKNKALQMVHEIHQELENILKEATWMDERTKQAALTKLNAMTFHIGYPYQLNDNFYQNLEIKPDNYLLSVLNLQIFNTDYAFNELRKPVNETNWIRQARITDLDAFYSQTENSLRKFLHFIFHNRDNSVLFYLLNLNLFCSYKYFV